MASRARSFAKALSYRLLGSALSSVAAFVATGSVRTSLWLGSADFVLKIAFYYLHERVWLRVAWGKNLGPVRTGAECFDSLPAD